MDAGPEPARVERGARECVDRREIRTANVADIAVHVLETASNPETHRAGMRSDEKEF